MYIDLYDTSVVGCSNKTDRDSNSEYKKKCKPRKCLIYTLYCGETGIRTPGTSRYNGFQDRRNRPLCHLSKTSFQKCFLLKALQRYDFILNMQDF